MNLHETTNFKANALDEASLRRQAPSIYATGPMGGVSRRYAFVPTARIVDGLSTNGWVPVSVEEQRIRKECRRGFQKHLLRFRRVDQMETLAEWNVELVLINSHDAGCAYQVHAGIYRRICSNGLVLSQDSFEALRFRHAGRVAEEVVEASFRLMEFVPRVGELVERFRSRLMTHQEGVMLCVHGLALRYGNVDASPIDPETLLQPRRPEDASMDLWTVLNRVQENLVRGGLSDGRRDRRGRLRGVRALRGIDSRVSLNKDLWGVAKRFADGELVEAPRAISLAA